MAKLLTEKQIKSWFISQGTSKPSLNNIKVVSFKTDRKNIISRQKFR